MIAYRPLPRILLSVGLALLIGPASTGHAQGTKTATPPAKAKAKVKAAESAKASEKDQDPIDLNSATAEELATLPGIGEANARKIIEGRPHKSVADLTGTGIAASTIDKLKPLVVVRPLPSPVDINGDDAEKLQTLPGVGPAMAKAIIDARPFASYDDLAKVKGIGPKKLDEFRGRLKFVKAEPVAEKAEEKPAEAPKRKMAKKAEAPADKTAKAERPKLAPGSKINLNKATKEELDLLPGIGEFYAQAIIDARPFSKIEDIMKIKGIKEIEFSKIKDVIVVK